MTIIRNGIFVLIWLISIMLIYSADLADAACSGTDVFKVNVHSPQGVLLKNASAVIDPVTGTACDTTDSDTINLYVYCQEPGNYTANLTCDGCTGSGHSNVVNTTILICRAPEDNKFTIQNRTSGRIAAFDEKGYLYLRGFNYSKQSNLNPPPRSYIIKNNSGNAVAFIDSMGNINLTGNISVRMQSLSPPKNSFVIMNRSRNVVAYISNTGNLILSGNIYFNWTGDI